VLLAYGFFIELAHFAGPGEGGEGVPDSQKGLQLEAVILLLLGFPYLPLE
jgi:hypothetical protein